MTSAGTGKTPPWPRRRSRRALRSRRREVPRAALQNSTVSGLGEATGPFTLRGKPRQSWTDDSKTRSPNSTAKDTSCFPRSPDAVQAVLDAAPEPMQQDGRWRAQIFLHDDPTRDAPLHRLLVEPSVVDAVEAILAGPARVVRGGKYAPGAGDGDLDRRPSQEGPALPRDASCPLRGCRPTGPCPASSRLGKFARGPSRNQAAGRRRTDSLSRMRGITRQSLGIGPVGSV